MYKGDAMKKVILFIVLGMILFAVAATAHESKVRPLKWANEDGKQNRVDWHISHYTLAYLYKTTFIGWTGRRDTGDSIRVQVTNMRRQGRIRVRFPYKVEWTGRGYWAPLMAGETRLYEFQAIHDPFNPGVTVRGRVIY